MGNFTEGFWNVFIFVCTVGGIFALYFFLLAFSADRRSGETSESTGHKWDEDLEELNNPLPRWWVNLFYVTLGWGILYLFLYPGLGSNDMVLGWTQVKQYEAEIAAANDRYGPIFDRFKDEAIPELAEMPDAIRTGERLFASYCTTCHGSDAGGVPGFPNLTDDDWLYGGGPEVIEKTILDGRNGIMPPWRDALGGDEGVRKVAQYVLKLGGREAGSATAQEGKPLFEKFCAACHMPAGTGNPQIGAPNLTDDVWLYGASTRAIEVSIANGRQGRMPPHREFLGEAKVHLLAAYVYSLSH